MLKKKECILSEGTVCFVIFVVVKRGGLVIPGSVERLCLVATLTIIIHLVSSVMPRWQMVIYAGFSCLLSCVEIPTCLMLGFGPCCVAFLMFYGRLPSEKEQPTLLSNIGFFNSAVMVTFLIVYSKLFVKAVAVLHISLSVCPSI